MAKVACIINKYDGNKPLPILEMWESYTGWYWFITEIDEKEDFAFGYVVGFENEWGAISRRELQNLRGSGGVWKVPKSNWFSNSHVTMVEAKEVRA